MTRYRIEISRLAAEDVDQAVTWLSGQVHYDKVTEWLGDLEAAIQSLETMPERCPIAAENGRWEPDVELRQLLFDKYPSVYRIIFTVKKKTVHVLQVRHGSRRFLFEE